ncbi:S-adenosylmethionine:tRNA ribosyltransferase-isomerase [Candidatus Saccharibacteria bacterium]|nr:S-adenosylmethionine:tRNA ribosyltransferase-isomerase [Candidatus Saccharibacteria bacterium]
MLVSDFNYDLPDERIAKYPPKTRGTTRLLVLNRKTGALQDSYYKNLDEFLNPGDVLILNDTRVMRSRLFCELPDGRKRELVVLEKHGDEPQRVMYRGKLHDGDCVFVSGAALRSAAARELAPAARGDGPDGRGRTVHKYTINIDRILGNGIAEVSSDMPLAELAEKYGEVPLPPYLHRDADENDTKRYQTVWAKNMGSAAAPTASLNMTDDLLERLRKKGVIIKYLTLHVGLGTFLPIRTDNIEDHKMHSEWFHIPEDTIAAIKSVLLAGDRPGGGPPPSLRGGGGEGLAGPARNRIIALGTTVARTLEYYAKTGKTEGEDNIFIYPGFEFQIVDALITNFHAPKSTVLMLASAFAGWDHLKNAYDHAVKEKYNFLSYGDSMFIC